MRKRKDLTVAEKIGATVYRLRLARKLTQRELAALARVTDETVGRIERGQVQPSTDTIAALAAAMDVTVDEIMGGDARPASLAALLAAARNLGTLADAVEREWRERYQLPATGE